MQKYDCLMLCVVNIQDMCDVFQECFTSPSENRKENHCVELCLTGRDVLVTLPTGHGKS